MGASRKRVQNVDDDHQSTRSKTRKNEGSRNKKLSHNMMKISSKTKNTVSSQQTNLRISAPEIAGVDQPESPDSLEEVCMETLEKSDTYEDDACGSSQPDGVLTSEGNDLIECDVAASKQHVNQDTPALEEGQCNQHDIGSQAAFQNAVLKSLADIKALIGLLESKIEALEAGSNLSKKEKLQLERLEKRSTLKEKPQHKWVIFQHLALCAGVGFYPTRSAPVVAKLAEILGISQVDVLEKIRHTIRPQCRTLLNKIYNEDAKSKLSVALNSSESIITEKMVNHLRGTKKPSPFPVYFTKTVFKDYLTKFSSKFVELFDMNKSNFPRLFERETGDRSSNNVIKSLTVNMLAYAALSFENSLQAFPKGEEAARYKQLLDLINANKKVRMEAPVDSPEEKKARYYVFDWIQFPLREELNDPRI